MSILGYYPGCSLSSSAAEYDMSVRAVAKALDVELREIPDWLCCGASSAHAIDREMALCLAADTLAKARAAKLDSVLAPCAMCYQRLATAAYEMQHSPELATRLTVALGQTPGSLSGMKAISLLQWLSDMGVDAIKSRVIKPLAGYRVACYYGCLLVRPPAITGAADPEAPRTMERIVEALGGATIRLSMATECCGGSFALSRTPVVLRQGRRIYDAAAGANVMVLACPMCHSNLDMRQAVYAAGRPALPVVYLTQLIGLAWGMSPQALGLDRHFVPFDPTPAVAEPKPLQPVEA